MNTIKLTQNTFIPQYFKCMPYLNKELKVLVLCRNTIIRS